MKSYINKTKVPFSFCVYALLVAMSIVDINLALAKSPLTISATYAKTKPTQDRNLVSQEEETISGPSSETIKSLLRKVATQQANCETQHCPSLKVLQEFEMVLKNYKNLREHAGLLTEENLSLKNQTRALSGVAQLPPSTSCYKKELLKNLMIDNGVSENGGFIFSKQPMTVEHSQCWSNSRKKKGSTVTLCEFPLAINIQTTGGDSSDPVVRKREYIFDLNGCDLLTARVLDESTKGIQDTNVTYKNCIEQWNKRTADAAMTLPESELMEDTIGYCFREHLLPPRRVKTGRKNPPVSFGPPTGK